MTGLKPFLCGLWDSIIYDTATLTRCDVGLTFKWTGGGGCPRSPGRAARCRASPVQHGWELLSVRNIPAPWAERHWDGGMSTLLPHFAREQHENSLPKACPQDREACFPSGHQPCFNQSLRLPLAFMILWTPSTSVTPCEEPESQQKSIKCYNFLGKKRLLCFRTSTTNNGSNLSLWLRTCHNNLFAFCGREEQHLALLWQWLI